MTEMKTFGNEASDRFVALLKEVRQKKYIDRTTLEATLNLPWGTIASWELGNVSPAANQFYAVVKAVGPEAYNRISFLNMEITLQQAQIIRELRNRKDEIGNTSARPFFNPKRMGADIQDIA